MVAKQTSLFGEERLPTLKQWREDKDITESRHKGNPESAKAHKRVAPFKMNTRERIYMRIVNSNGVTCEEIEREFHLKHQTASARISELKADKRIRADGTRNGYAILRAS